MNLSPAAEAPFGDHDAFQAFLGDHALAHKAIDMARQRAGKAVTSRPMADSPMENLDWMLDHWQTHIEIGIDTGLPVPDLSGYDLTDEGQYYEWMRTVHAPLHEQINEFYGIVS